ncbi:MAG: TonB-dependent receptor [Chitinophagales bacterium]|nr:TonB-dependent receptor [Chitinophagales bacterium]
MTKKFLPFIALLICGMAQAQNTFTAIIKDKVTEEPLIGATAIIIGTTNGAASNENGLLTITNIPDGEYIIRFSFLGYRQKDDTITFPLEITGPMEILLQGDEEEMEEVVVTSTRSNISIQNIPTRIEVLGIEEIEEKANMKPGDIRMILNETTGIQTQQTSATSANASIRIQGLDGRYTQILKDGFPLYSGAASGLGLLQIPPLDLSQVEIIKGSASTLYGGGAIAGLINLISKTPKEEREIRFHINGTSALGLDVNGFYAQKFEKLGVTLFASSNSNRAYDPSDIGLSAIPKFSRYNVNPKMFFYFNEKTTMDIGVNTAFETRLGGDMRYIKGEGDSTHSYFERNATQRVSTQFSLRHIINAASSINFKNSYSYFNRKLAIPTYTFNGIQHGNFSEISYRHSKEKSEWVTGINLWTDLFDETVLDTSLQRDYDMITMGLFMQNTVKATNWLSIESGVRGDYVFDYGLAVLPRLSLLIKITDKLSSRLGGGFGYKAPTIFTEESERIQYQGVIPISSTMNKLERSYGANLDVNYRTPIGEKVTLSINQLFFYTYLNSPLMLVPISPGTLQFQNVIGHIDTKGGETNITFKYSDFKWYLGYTFTDATIHSGGVRTPNTLTAKHRVNAVLMYEVEDKWKVGLEAYYFSKQLLNDGTTGRPYWICGAMVEKIWEKVSVYVNFENFTNTRQTKFDSIYTGTITNPTFRDIYAPLDGIVVNGGIKVRL